MMSFSLFASCFLFSQTRSVGINTNTPDASAILDINATPPSSTQKRGFLLPRIALLNLTDQVTIPTPAKGLLVYNTADAGVYPNNVTANNYYFWDGAKWMAMPLRNFVEDAVKPRIFYIEDNGTQTFTQAQINSQTANVTPTDNLVVFSGTPQINVANTITANGNSTFTINVSGLYDFSAFVNYNPMNVTSINHTGATVPTSIYQRAFLNVKIQTSVNNGATWSNTNAISRIGWGTGSGGYLKTASIISFPLQLQKGTMFRLVIANPFPPNSNNDHGNDGNPYLGTSENVPVAKGIRVQLLDFNL